MAESTAVSKLGTALLTVGSLAFSPPSYATDDIFVAGTKPYQRPQGAPIIRQVDKNAPWKQTQLYGVSKPYPDSLKFLKDQGNWFSPFMHPGMRGPYDIRGWHKARAAQDRASRSRK